MNKSIFAEFCYMTSLHGWNYFPYKNFRFRHVLFWAIIILSSIIGGGLLMKQHIEGVNSILRFVLV